MTEHETNNTLLNSLALALVEHPRASLQELACAIGVSKATLYRFCRTRENLIERLIQRSIESYQEAIRDADLDTAEPREGIRRLLENYYMNKELTIFIIQYWQPELLENGECLKAQEKIDAFFLRGQQSGHFRVDISAAAIAECFHGLFFAMIEAERLGRVPRTRVLTIIELILLEGASTAS
ncbi:TetR/AcrR family transcriptional regulator [Marinomonas sp. UCMA 3892]|jgi:TetR/AcrR family transcriptional regulator, mexCD-oprJ operon repressor|uniref:Putative transcriptional regulator, TetR family n=1 Tax=Marinomonas sp. (strain MWYL1) TaxID=400668 RepID=A6VRZ9_MARMS|nr:TetR/AcrR family transcriptional regulator [Marinomonas sp. UCMA 3892]NLU97539.1 TetR/AcrR family transcriptional regulator [Marinomonas sp. UCMA 3892]